MDCLTHLDAYQKSWALRAADASAWPTKIWGDFSSTAKGCEVHETGGSKMSLTFLAHVLRKKINTNKLSATLAKKMTIIQRPAFKIFKYLRNQMLQKETESFQTTFKWWAFFFASTITNFTIAPCLLFVQGVPTIPEVPARPGREVWGTPGVF